MSSGIHLLAFRFIFVHCFVFPTEYNCLFIFQGFHSCVNNLTGSHTILGYKNYNDINKLLIFFSYFSVQSKHTLGSIPLLAYHMHWAPYSDTINHSCLWLLPSNTSLPACLPCIIITNACLCSFVLASAFSLH